MKSNKQCRFRRTLALLPFYLLRFLTLHATASEQHRNLDGGSLSDNPDAGGGGRGLEILYQYRDAVDDIDRRLVIRFWR